MEINCAMGAHKRQSKAKQSEKVPFEIRAHATSSVLGSPCVVLRVAGQSLEIYVCVCVGVDACRVDARMVHTCPRCDSMRRGRDERQSERAGGLGVVVAFGTFITL